MKNNITRININNLNVKKDKKKTLKKSKNSINYNDFLKKHKKNKSLDNIIINTINNSDKKYKKKLKKSFKKPKRVKISDSKPEIKIIEDIIENKEKDSLKKIKIGETENKERDNKEIDNLKKIKIGETENKEIDNFKKIKIEENIVQPIFKINRKYTKIKSKKKKGGKNKKSKKSKKVTFEINNKKENKKIDNITDKEMLESLNKNGIKLSGTSKKLIKDIYMCIIDEKIIIKKE
jgi:hypothetical protein